MIWWRAGEDGVVTKYKNRRRSDVAVQALLTAALWFLLPTEIRKVGTVLFGTLTIPHVIAQQRIAIMFTDDAVIYRPAFRSPRRIKFEHIAEINKMNVPRFVGGIFSGWYPGVELRLLGGATVIWPLQVSEPREALLQLQRMTGKTIR